jgi:hypothetical protein
MNTDRLLGNGASSTFGKSEIDRRAESSHATEFRLLLFVWLAAMLCMTLVGGTAKASGCDLTFAEAKSIVASSFDSSPDPRIDTNTDGVVTESEMEAFLSDACVVAAVQDRR